MCNNKFEKITYFRQKYQESFRTAEYPLHQLIRLGRLETHTTLSIRNPRLGLFVAMVSLSLL